MTSHTPTWAKEPSLLTFFVLAYAISWGIEIPLALRSQGIIDASIPFSLHYLAAYGPMLAALIVTGRTAGRDGLQELFGRVLRWRVRPVWWLVAIAPLFLRALVAATSGLIRGRWPDLAALGQVDFMPDLGAPCSCGS